MYCPKCNTCYLDDGKFCQDCGAPLIQNAVYSEKKTFPVKILLAIAALSLSLVAGLYALYNRDGATQAGKVPDPGLPVSAVHFTADNPMNGGADMTRHARHAAGRNLRRDETAASPASASLAAAAPAAAAVPGEKACSGKAPKEVGTPRPVKAGGQVAGGGSLSSTAGRDSAASKTAGRQPQMVVIRDPLSAETRN